MCRLVVCGPDRQIELAVPTGVLVADLLPALLHHLGEELADTGLPHGGWVLQRLGQPPLDEDASVADLDLRDGEVVHVRPRADQIPPIAFDDLIDGVATGIRSRAGLWRPEMAGWAARGALAVLLGLGVVTVALPGPALPRTVAAGAAALGCLLAAFAAARAAGERSAGLIAAVAGIAFATLAGVLAPGGTLTAGGPQLLAGAVVGAAAACLAMGALGWNGPLFTGVLAAALLTAIGGAAATFLPLDAGEAGAIVAVTATIAVVGVPMAAFRLARQRLTPLPTDPEHLQQEIDPEPSAGVLAGAAATDTFMTALYAGLAVPAAAALALLALRDGWAGATLVALIALVRLLSARAMTSAWHRLAQAVPALAGPAVLAGHTLAGLAPGTRLLLLAALPVAGFLLVLAGRVLPGRRLMPYWARIGDLVQTAATLALLPMLLAVLDVYAYARALGG